MKKTVTASLVVVIALALGVVCAGCTSSTTPSPSPSATAVVGNTTALGASLSNATNITVVQGQNFTMQLQSNPSTGYRWEPSYDNSSIMLVNRTYIASNATLPGAPGADVFTFQGTTTGTSLITFNNVGPSNQTVNNVTYTITCTAENVSTGNAVLVSSGQNFTLQQPANPSTGYRWNATYDNATLTLVNQTFVGSNASAALVGAGGTELFTFRGTQMGTGVIVLSYISPGNETTTTVPYSVIITS